MMKWNQRFSVIEWKKGGIFQYENFVKVDGWILAAYHRPMFGDIEFRVEFPVEIDGAKLFRGGCSSIHEGKRMAFATYRQIREKLEMTRKQEAEDVRRVREMISDMLGKMDTLKERTGYFPPMELNLTDEDIETLRRFSRSIDIPTNPGGRE